MDSKSTSSQELYERLGSASAPVLVDVRREDAFAADEAMIIGAIRRSPEAIARWQYVPPKGRDTFAYCVHGDEVSQGVARELHEAGTNAAYLEGGITDWKGTRFPDAEEAWSLREHVGHPRTSQDRPHRLSMADQPLRQSRGGLHLRFTGEVAKVAADVGYRRRG